MNLKKILLSVAGYDPTSGAGIVLDLRVFQKYGYYGMGVLTSLTSQNTQTVKKVHCPTSRFVFEQYRHLRADVEFSGIKVGMIGCAENITVIAKILTDNPKIPIVIDPVFKSSGGNWLYDKKSIPAYMAEIRAKASLLTPNLAEAEWISGIKVRNVAEMRTSAEKIYALTSTPCLIKGGHLRDQNVDILFDGKTYIRFKNKKLKKTVHGTGCFLSSSILCHLANGSPLDQAASLAIKATHEAIKKAAQIGKGQLIIGDIQSTAS
ncbi:MAG: bifunctional hydroxymethylpyrimidine kinase/phosphomethylpyrimidine kinase [Candidatus Aminicenantaceae bacterium]